ncbi:MAG: hypothetical protein AAF483_22590 [Planctomycetota bacterium]
MFNGELQVPAYGETIGEPTDPDDALGTESDADYGFGSEGRIREVANGLRISKCACFWQRVAPEFTLDGLTYRFYPQYDEVRGSGFATNHVLMGAAYLRAWVGVGTTDVRGSGNPNPPPADPDEGPWGSARFAASSGSHLIVVRLLTAYALVWHPGSSSFFPLAYRAENFSFTMSQPCRNYTGTISPAQNGAAEIYLPPGRGYFAYDGITIPTEELAPELLSQINGYSVAVTFD